MKNIILGIFAIAIFSLSTVSCSKDNDCENIGYLLHEGIGDVMSKDGGVIKILLDDADTVIITNSKKFDIDINTRVSFVGEIISERKTGDNNFYEFRAIVIDKILTKEPLLKSALDADEELAKEVGNDVIHLSSAYIESKYLNIKFYIWHGGAGIKHFINMVVDNTKGPINVDEKGVLTLDMELRQNAYDDFARYESRNFVSFNIENYLKLDKLETLKLNIKYKTSGSTFETKILEYKLPKKITPASMNKSSEIIPTSNAIIK